jgi:sugar lactone lactonase YvrE
MPASVVFQTPPPVVPIQYSSGTRDTEPATATDTAAARRDPSSRQRTVFALKAAGPDGRIYITDSGIGFASDGSVTHPGKSRVFVLDGRNAREAVVLPAQSGANGIAWDAANTRWLIVGFNSPNIFAWNGGRDSATVIGTGPGGADGLLILADGRALLSSWADSSLTVFANGVSTTLRSGLNAPADLGYDPARKLVAVPLFLDNRVEFWTVK